ncbi:YjbF family lipoprotein [Pseudoxanthomonas spadix]|uniref:YjbF family lipoprotein n=1 Tax=Pseudoxanthomonas spadix TaxID=415229 RepID=UPI000EFEF1EA|nr:YjbF family lipoprotein [Pseudoxanthomonas spadix]RMW96556.1 YjbF family lipoprotein [Pseudoxanthomonas spadix]
MSAPPIHRPRRLAAGRRRLLACAVALAALAGCSTTSRASYDALRTIVASHRELAPTPAQVAALPYAQILLNWPDGSALMVLGNDDAGQTSWYSNDRHMVYLRDGLLVGSTGFAQDAMQIRIEGDNPFDELTRAAQATTVIRRYDWMPGYRYGAVVRGRLVRRGRETVRILGTDRQLDHFEEALEGPGLRALNQYWVDPASGEIWKSRQLVAPGLSVEITQLKPYRPQR